MAVREKGKMEPVALDPSKAGTMSLGEAFARGAVIVVLTVGSVFALRFLHDVYNYVVHGKAGP